jgi:hypothetical protein
MALPSLQKKWIIEGQARGIDELRFMEGPIPKVDDYGVLVKLHAAAMNYRDILIPSVSLAVLFMCSLKLFLLAVRLRL